MALAEILSQISSCDTQKPYIFISYSAQDKELVWRDVLEFQRMGYNVWLDEKNLDKTKASWKEDALTAIEDMYCMLVVFYVSKSSLVSEACYRELSKTTDEFTTALHYGPVKFIAVDVDEIGNIMDFTRELHQSVVQNPELTKEVKSKMLITLHQFMRDFFDSNNEKVRVHPKNEPNRKMNYYEEIVASFPNSTQNQPRFAAAKVIPDVQDERYTEVEHNLQAEAEARKKAEEQVRLLKAIVASMERPEAEDQAGKEKEDRTYTRKQIEYAIAQANSQDFSSYSQILVGDEITPAKLKNAVNAYAKKVVPEEVLGLMDCTLFGSAKEGCIITCDGVYSEQFKGRPILLGKVASYSIGKEAYDVLIRYRDDTVQKFFIPTGRQKRILRFLDAVLKLK